jgi:ATP-dependent DNA helicase RecG
VRGGESETLELKRTTGERREAARAICAMLNHRIERVDFAEGRQLLVVTVQPGGGQPYSYRGRAFRRVGNTSQELSREEYNRILLERLHGEQRWENQPAVGWTVPIWR